MAREYTNKLLEMVEEGLLDNDEVVEEYEDETFIDVNDTGGKW